MPFALSSRPRRTAAFVPVCLGLLASFAAAANEGPASTAAALPADHYFVGDEKVDLDFSADWIAAVPAPGLGLDALVAAAGTAGVEFAPVDEWQTTGHDVTLLRVLPGADPRRLRAAIVALRDDPAVGFAGPVYFHGETLQVLSDVLFVEFAPEADAAALLARHLVEDAGSVETFPRVRRLRLARGNDRAILDVVEDFRRSPGVVFAEPRFAWRAAHASWPDPLWAQQWAHRNTGGGGRAADADMDVDEAHDIGTGGPGITVAIIDEGVDMDHEDLAANVVAGFDVTDQSGSPPEGVAGNAACSDGHGTACAGIVAAAGGNGKGVVGVAPDATLMSVRIGRGSVWTTNDWAAAGINRAWQNGADVLSNSWGGGSSSALINSAVNSARSSGRGGLGAVVLFSSGNDDASSVSYPSSLSNVVSVGASSPCDERKSPSSCDGEWWWGSSYGTGLDVVAPGVQIQTADVAGSCGYVSGQYVADFNGTSAACPNAAGVAALVLAADPTLTAAAVQTILQASADDQVGVPGEDLPGRDNFMGFGRVNALQALVAAGAGSAPPAIGSVAPASGPQRGGTLVTITGSNFLGTPTVAIGGVAAAGVTRVDSSTITCLAPASVALGARDVEVGALGGAATAPGGFEYVANPVSLAWTGQPDQGAVMTLRMEGLANGKWALVVSDVAGSWTVKGYELGLRKQGASYFGVLHYLSESRLSSTGVGTRDYVVPASVPVFTNLYFQGLAPDASGTLVVTNVSPATIF